MSTLTNKVIAITKSKDAAGDAFDELIHQGAQLVFIPSISVEAIPDTPLFNTAVREIETFHYLIFTSPAAVKFYAHKIEQLNVHVDYTKLSVACVGLKTGEECGNFGIPVNILPEAFNAASLSRELAKNDLKGKRILIPRSSIAREELAKELSYQGAFVSSIAIYETKMPPADEIKKLKDSFAEKKIDLIAFTSPSSFSNFLLIFNISQPGEFFKNYKVAAIGNTTKNAIAGSAVKVDIVPAETSLKGLFKSILEFYKQ